ncbi:MAG: CRISPR-associated helicase Cas3' [Bacteroidales bacterium]
MKPIAHLKHNVFGFFDIQELSEHLYGVGQLASTFAELFLNAEWGKVIGQWHDVGKYSEIFQQYIKVNSGYEVGSLLGKVDHTSAGAILAKDILPNGYWQPIAYCIAGHHAGLHNWYPEPGLSGSLLERLTKFELLNSIRGNLGKEIVDYKNLSAPTGKALPCESIHLWIRMLFSCLVDADYLDTESFMNPESFEKRGKYESLSALKKRFENYITRFAEKSEVSELNQIRDSVLKQCIESGLLEPGFFSITVPTGGGKTLSSMAWALEHAVKFNKKRIIFAIPYTSIISQTVQVYRDIFGELNVIEHHSNINDETTSDESKLSVENWDAPIIVTTNVQLFESLYANSTSKCRKLHNLVNSIIILDEAQMLPPEFLKPILSVLKSLVDDFGASILFSTATQPVLTGTIGGSGKNAFRGIETERIREIVPDFKCLTSKLKRVDVQMPENIHKNMEWKEVADELMQFDQVLCIVNTRKDCRSLLHLMPKDTIHLSRMMCSAHIMDVIVQIKERLRNGESIRVISTQLIEAGVDIDFPVVYRALAGLDSIAQSAGRCNREGKLSKEGKLGLTKVFCPPKNTPLGLMRKGSETLKEMLGTTTCNNPLAPESYKKYFDLFYSKIQNFDKPNIKNLLWQDAAQMKFQFATAARDFKLINDRGSETILIEYKGGSDLIRLFKRKGPESWLMRKLQRYSVSVNAHDFERIRAAGLIEQIHGCWVQSYETLYNNKVGMMSDGEWLEEIHII